MLGSANPEGNRRHDVRGTHPSIYVREGIAAEDSWSTDTLARLLPVDVGNDTGTVVLRGSLRWRVKGRPHQALPSPGAVAWLPRSWLGVSRLALTRSTTYLENHNPYFHTVAFYLSSGSCSLQCLKSLIHRYRLSKRLVHHTHWPRSRGWPACCQKPHFAGDVQRSVIIQSSHCFNNNLVTHCQTTGACHSARGRGSNN